MAGETAAGADAEPAALFDRYADTIYNYCFRRCGSWSVAEDLTATVFLQAWRTRHRMVQVDSSPLAWLYGVAINVCRNHSRSVRRSRAALSRIRLDDVQPDHSEDTAGRIDDQRRLAEIQLQLARLSPADRDTFVLVVWQELSYAEAAVALGVPLGTIRSRISRVRRTLRLEEGSQP